MSNMKTLIDWLIKNANAERYLFTLQDFRSLFPNLAEAAFKTLLSRSVKSGYLTRLCRGLYSYQHAIPNTGLILFHAASYLRSDEFNYISLETTLSDAGVISQMPINYISIMSSGRSNTISCGSIGTIEFVHTNQKPEDIMRHLTYDSERRLWRASIRLAIRDMKASHRNCDLIDWEIANELI